jgi:putative oxidoreductase
MYRLTTLHDRAFAQLDRLAPVLLPTLARLIFAGVLLGYFWASAKTKLGADLLHPSVGAFFQIFPRATDAVSGDVSRLTAFHWLVVEAGTLAEFVLPLLLVLGLLTRLAALGMIGFVLVQTATDIWGHGVAVGGWFNRDSTELIADQRALWMLLFLILASLGAGPLSVDRLLRRS